MPVALLERRPEVMLSTGSNADLTTLPQTKLSGNGGEPPVEVRTAVAAAEPPDRNKFSPDQHLLKAQTDAEFNAIAANLGDVAANMQRIDEQHRAASN